MRTHFRQRERGDGSRSIALPEYHQFVAALALDGIMTSGPEAI